MEQHEKCTMDTPNPGAHMCQICVLDHNMVCPKHGGLPMFDYLQQDRDKKERERTWLATPKSGE